MAFHRLTTPTYFGGLPAGYDYLNDPADPSVGGSGVPALTDGIKSGGPNDGTYFVAFGEDGQSAFANRPAVALGTNTDLLDDVLRTSIPSITFADATAAGAVTSIALVGQIYVGDSGTANNQSTRDKIVRITDQNNNDLEISGTKIVATLIHDGASVNVVGTEASAFRTNATVTVAPPIPNTQTYRVWYGVRNNYTNIAMVDRSALFEESLRTINNVPGEVRSLLRQVHSEASVNQAWDAAFDSTIRSLASAGLNERYRRATLQPAGFVTGDFNDAGAGAVILRDGQAVTLKADDFLLTGLAWPDGNHALLKLVPEDNRSIATTAISGNGGGDFGVWHESEWKALNTAGDAGMSTRGKSAGPALIEVVPYDMRLATFNGDTLLTFIDASSATATINPDSGSGTTARKTVECGAGQYFSLTGPVRTAIRVGLDLLEVTDSSGRVRTFIIVEILSATRVEVELPTGNSPLFSTTAEPGCTIRVIQSLVRIGGYLGNDAVENKMSRPLLVIPPAILTTDVASESVAPCSFFGAQTGSAVDATAQARRARAVEFGATGNPDSGGVVDGTIDVNAWINGDGSAVLKSWSLLSGNASVDEFGNAILDDVVCESITCIDVVADDILAHTVRVTEPEQYFVLDEDFIAFQQVFTPNLIHTFENTWAFNEIAGTITPNNAISTAKNPGQIEFVGGGGGVSKRLAVYPTTLLPFAFSTWDHLTVIAKVVDDPANVAATMEVVIADSTTGGGNDMLGVAYFNGIGWCVRHIVGGVSGAHNFAVLGAQVNGEFVVVRFVKNGVDIDVSFNGTVILTVTAAQIPGGLGTLNIYLEQTVGDTEITTWTLDKVTFRTFPSTNRAGA